MHQTSLKRTIYSLWRPPRIKTWTCVTVLNCWCRRFSLYRIATRLVADENSSRRAVRYLYITIQVCRLPQGLIAVFELVSIIIINIWIMAAKLNILVCDMEQSMQDSAKHVSFLTWWSCIQTIMEAFEIHREERVIANTIKKQFDKEFSKQSQLLKLFSRVMELRRWKEFWQSHCPPDPQLYVCNF